MAEVVLFGQEKIKVILSQHFKAYYNYNINSLDDEDEDNIDELRAESATAIDAFQALFADRNEFSDTNAIQKFFSGAFSANEEAVLQKLYLWIGQSISRHGVEDGKIYRSAEMPDELASSIECFVKTCKALRDDEDYLRPSLWPVVEIVKIGLQQSPLLNRGIVLADLPGIITQTLLVGED